MRNKQGFKNISEFRVFDKLKAANAGVSINNYNSLQEHPELILFEGWFDKNFGQIVLDDRETQKDMGKAA